MHTEQTCEIVFPNHYTGKDFFFFYIKKCHNNWLQQQVFLRIWHSDILNIIQKIYTKSRYVHTSACTDEGEF